jgi:hypothetical protein
MSDPAILKRLEELELRIPEAEMPYFEEFVKDLERAAKFIREVDRSYLEEPAVVFTPAKS